jgi:hypothetical protein
MRVVGRRARERRSKVPFDRPGCRRGRRRARFSRYWRGTGDVVTGMACQEYDLELRRYDGRGWRATFSPSGFEHSLTSYAGSGWARSPWEAVQRAARDALLRLEAPELASRDWTGTDELPR